jgi:plastocyanin
MVDLRHSSDTFRRVSAEVRGWKRRALAPALTLVITGAVIAGAGVAGAADSATVYVTEGNQCNAFTAVAGTPCTPQERADVTIEEGETVTWDFDTGTGYHNVASSNAVAADPEWEEWDGPFQNTGSYSRQFLAAGVYEFVCEAHPGMEGSVTVVEGDGSPTPIPTATPTPTPTPTPTATPTATATSTAAASTATDDHTLTPAPGHGAKDAVAPRLQTMRVTGRAGSVKVRFWLSEPATVVITAKRRGSKSVLASATVHSPAGTRTVTLREKSFKRGSYRVTLRASDAMGNKAAAPARTARVRR